MSVSPRIYRPKDAQAYLGCGKAFFYKLVKDGYLVKSRKLSKNFVFWTKGDLDAAVELMVKESES